MSKKNNKLYALNLLLFLSASIVVIEIAIMYFLHDVGIESVFVEALIDSIVLITLIFPILFFVFFKNIVKKNQELTLATEELSAVKDGLERSVFSRTKDLEQRNLDLEASIRQLADHRKQSSLLAELSQQLLVSRDLEELSAVVRRMAPKLLQDAAAALYVFRSSRDLIELLVEWGHAAAPAASFGPDDCWSLRLGRPHVVAPAGGNARCSHLEVGQEKTTLCIPLNGGEQIVGVLQLEYESGAEPFDPETGRLPAHLSNLAQTLALGLVNVGLKQTLRSQAFRDQLTGLYNKRFIDETLRVEVERAKRSGAPFSIVMIDIDRFKDFNDRFGHAAGDAVLATVGRFLEENVRTGDLACRFGGEEFMILLPNVALDTAVGRAEQLRRSLEKLPLEYDGRPLGHITISCGVANFPLDAKEIQPLIQAADDALYASKRNGRNKVTSWRDMEKKVSSLEKRRQNAQLSKET